MPNDLQLAVELQRKSMAPMEQVIGFVFALGYTPEDCELEHHDDGRLVLLVEKVPAFELRMSMRSVKHDGARDRYAVEITSEPKVLTWPMPKRIQVSGTVSE